MKDISRRTLQAYLAFRAAVEGWAGAATWRRPALAVVVAAGLLGLALAGCGGSEGASPSVRIVSPQNGATVPAGDVAVQVEVSNFRVVDRLGGADAKGEGHVHFYIDVDDVPTTPGRPAVSREGTYHAAGVTSHTWANVQPGTHTFAVQLVNNTHTPLDPLATARVTVTVR